MATLENQTRYKILDTGYVKSDRSGTQLTGTNNLVNSGNAISLNITDIRYGQPANIDNSPVPGVLADSQGNIPLNVVSNPHPIITLRGILDRTNSTDYVRARYLNDMKKTGGIKLLWYADTGTPSKSEIVDVLGEYNKSSTGNTDNGGFYVNDAHIGSNGETKGQPFTSGDNPHFHVHVKDFSLSQPTSSKFWDYTLTLEIDDI